MASIYSKLLPDILEKNNFDSKSGPIVLVVCGGSDVSQDILQEFAEKFGMPSSLS
jgi:hypothetical protein